MIYRLLPALIALALVLGACTAGVTPGTPSTPASAESTPVGGRPTETSAPAIGPTAASATVLYVGHTEGIGVFVRRTPSLADKLKAWPDGTPMVVVGADRQQGGQNWKNVRDPDGNVGWVPAEYLVERAQATVAPPPAKPTVSVPGPTPVPKVASPAVSPRPR